MGVFNKKLLCILKGFICSYYIYRNLCSMLIENYLLIEIREFLF